MGICLNVHCLIGDLHVSHGLLTTLACAQLSTARINDYHTNTFHYFTKDMNASLEQPMQWCAFPLHSFARSAAWSQDGMQVAPPCSCKIGTVIYFQMGCARTLHTLNKIFSAGNRYWAILVVIVSFALKDGTQSMKPSQRREI